MWHVLSHSARLLEGMSQFTKVSCVVTASLVSTDKAGAMGFEARNRITQIIRKREKFKFCIKCISSLTLMMVDFSCEILNSLTKEKKGLITFPNFHLEFPNFYYLSLRYCDMCLVAQSCPTLCNLLDWLLCLWDFSGKNTGVGCHFPPPGDLPDPGIKDKSSVSPTLQADS